MIRIDRSSVPAPKALTDSHAEARRTAAIEYFARAESKRQQRRFDFRLVFAQPELNERLRALFKDKCAYCERLVSFDKPGVPFLDRFRPVSGAIGGDGKVTVDAYWWMAFEWQNMYGCCAMCNRAKGSRFPITGTRLTYRDRLKMARERPLLLDPCADDPDEHLLFHDDGRVSGTTDRGRTTVEILSLNREELLTLRGEVAKEMLVIRDSLSSSDPSGLTLDPALSFTAMRRQLLNRARQSPTRQKTLQSSARKGQVAHESKHAASSLDAPNRDVQRERARTRYIQSVTLRNIGVHHELKVSLGGADATGAPWMVLLGENGVGKSTLLKAIGFALAGQSQWEQLGPFALGLLPTRKGSDGKVGEIEVRLTDGEILQLRIDAGRQLVSGTASDAKLYVLGFGATRLPPTHAHPPPPEPSYLRLLNLFDPFSPLGDAVHWLCSLSALQFERAGRALRSLLDLPETAVFHQRRGTVWLDESGTATPIDQLSDGYQTIIGVGCDIMSVLLQSDLPIELAEGIVLIDEIGNHLHPSWRMRIVAALKVAFPRIQFIATTHEPLCLRGLDNDEVAVLRKDAMGQVVLLADLPPIRGMLVDQILSSQYFGLSSTVDPDFAAKLDTYYGLMAKKDKSAAEQAHLAELAPMMDRMRLVGDSPREQILLRAIDNFVMEADKSAKPIDPAQLPEDVKNNLLGLLSDLGLPGDGAGEPPT